MTQILLNQGGAVVAGVKAFGSAYYNYLANNGGPDGGAFNNGTAVNGRMDQYKQCWHAYTGTMYDKRPPFGYGTYITQNRLYAHTRQLYTMPRDVVDFYASHVYPGVIDDQGVANDERLEEGIPLICDDNQRAAIKQVWQWSAWGRAVSQWITYAAAVGDVFLVQVDDVEGGKVYMEVREPWKVKECILERGNVVLYTEEYSTWDKVESKYYKYKRTMTETRIQEFYDNDPHDFGSGADYENPYGWVPVVYVQHLASPEQPGTPAFRGWRTFDELNSIASRLDDYLLLQADSPTGISKAGVVTTLQIDGRKQPTSERGLMILQFDSEAQKLDLSGNLDVPAMEVRVTSLLSELRERNLEVTTYQRLREGGNPSGVAARRLLGDVEGRLEGPSGNYDNALIHALRQSVAIAGMRYQERDLVRDAPNGWVKNTDQQKVFAPYDMESYPSGDLNFGIAPRPLVSDTDFDIAAAKQARYTALGIAANEPLNVPLVYQLKNPKVLDNDDATDKDIADLLKAQDEEAARNQARMPQALTDTNGQAVTVQPEKEQGG